jgi:hypothetical protein
MLRRHVVDNWGMADAEPSGDSGPSWWSNVWLRAGLLHPVLFITPWMGVCLFLATRSGSHINNVAWGIWFIPLSAIASFITTAVMAARHPLTPANRVRLVLLGLLASGVALVLGFVGWFYAANVACHGGYECPF